MKKLANRGPLEHVGGGLALEEASQFSSWAVEL